MRLNERTKKLLEGFRARARVQVRAEHEAAKAAVREQQEKIQKHHEEILALTRELNRANEKKSLAFAARDAAQEEQRRPSRYADKQAHKRAADLLAKREAECDKAANESGAI
jgi:hypothetical protein